MLKKIRFAVVFSALSAAAAVPLAAQPIRYLFTGIGSGTLNGNAFTRQTFTFDIAANASNVNPSGFGPGVPDVGNLTALFSITGTGSGSFSNVYVFNHQTNQVVGFGSSANSDLIDIGNNSVGLGTYGLTTAFGPIPNTTSLFFSQFTNQQTSAGNLTFTNVASASFEAQLTSTVPEPATVVLFMSGAAVIALAARRRRNA